MAAEPSAQPVSAVAITGAGGWLGTALLEAIGAAREARPTSYPVVRALVRHPSEVGNVLEAASFAQVFIGDVRDRSVVDELLDGMEGAAVIHAAGVIHPARAAEFESVNVGGTRTAVESASRVGARRIVHVSSNSAFGCNPTPEDSFRANEPFNPYMGYGRSKMEAEIVAGTAGDPQLERVIIRPPWFYGPYQPLRQTRFFASVRRGRFPVVGDGLNRRSMVQVEALAQAALQACVAPHAAGRSYWIADAHPYTMLEVIRAVREALELEGLAVSGRIPRLPGAVADIARLADAAIQSRGGYVQEIHVLSEMNQTIACDVSDAVRDLGYDPPGELLPGMRRAIAWCRQTGVEL
ncbi:MAG: NAD(P)-dependent oxidoreductase [Acidobacteria bacterium]|nr:NAD(P)-dependent oxidoreductase [Acidobacteriota bacterium]